jgi:hypothetical protein
MEAKNDPIYAGELTSNTKFPDLLEGVFNLDVLENELVKGLIKTSKQGKKTLRIKIKKRKEPSKFGDTHYIEIDQFIPKSKEA